MLAIKALVIGLGLLIVASMGLLVYGFYSGVADRPATEEYQEAEAAGQLSEIVLPLPEGCRIVDALGDGRRLIIRTGDSPHCQRVFVVDTKTNAVISTIRTGP